MLKSFHNFYKEVQPYGTPIIIIGSVVMTYLMTKFGSIIELLGLPSVAALAFFSVSLIFGFSALFFLRARNYLNERRLERPTYLDVIIERGAVKILKGGKKVNVQYIQSIPRAFLGDSVEQVCLTDVIFNYEKPIGAYNFDVRAIGNYHVPLAVKQCMSHNVCVVSFHNLYQFEGKTFYIQFYNHDNT